MAGEYDYLSTDSYAGYDPEELQAKIAKEKYDEYIARFLPHLGALRDDVTSASYVTDLAGQAESLSERATNAGRGLVNAQRGRMGLAATEMNASDTLRDGMAKVSSYNTGLRAATDLQNKLLVGG